MIGEQLDTEPTFTIVYLTDEIEKEPYVLNSTSNN
jgi:hypothetical protein